MCREGSASILAPTLVFFGLLHDSFVQYLSWIAGIREVALGEGVSACEVRVVGRLEELQAIGDEVVLST